MLNKVKSACGGNRASCILLILLSSFLLSGCSPILDSDIKDSTILQDNSALQNPTETVTIPDNEEDLLQDLESLTDPDTDTDLSDLEQELNQSQ